MADPRNMAAMVNWSTRELSLALSIVGNELTRRAALRDGAVEALNEAREQAARVAWADREAEAG